MTQIDQELLRNKFEILNEKIGKLKRFQGVDKNTFIEDFEQNELADRLLQVAVEVILDVSRHMIISLGLKTPDDSHGLFKILNEAGVLSREFVDRNEKLPGLRNRLVHVYDDIDHGKIYDYIQTHLGELKKFISEISSYITEEQ